MILSLLAAAALAQDEPIPQPAAPAPMQTVQQLPPDDLTQAKNAAARGDAPEALSRYLRVLATRPDDADALTGAGQAALAVGDLNAASGFFGRAEVKAPNNGQVKAGIASMLVRQGDARGALRYFRQAASLGVPEAILAADRGLAYDLRGENRRAQAEYQTALRTHPGNPETIKRLALSQAIAGEQAAALATLDPLLRRADPSAWRSRMFARALAGDVSGADADAALVLNAQQAASLAPYLAKLPTLKPTEKAAAVFLGRFPTAARPPQAVAAATPMPTPAPKPPFSNVPLPPPPAPIPAPAPAVAEAAPEAPASMVDLGPTTATTAARPPLTRKERLAEARAKVAELRERLKVAEAAKQAKIEAHNPRRYWAQVASGANRRDMPKAWAKLKASHGADLAGRSPWVTPFRFTNRLLIGPFPSADAAQDWVDAKRAKGMSTFQVTTEAGAQVSPLR